MATCGQRPGIWGVSGSGIALAAAVRGMRVPAVSLVDLFLRLIAMHRAARVAA